jgi:hypothetical protein
LQIRLRHIVVVGSAGAAGLIVGLGTFASASDDPQNSYAPHGVAVERPTQQFTHLNNGMSVGAVLADTSAPRPDLMQVTGLGGKVGYIIVADVFPTRPILGPEAAARQEAAAGYLTDADGNVTAPVYAPDAKTVIDRLLIGTVTQADQ